MPEASDPGVARADDIEDDLDEPFGHLPAEGPVAGDDDDPWDDDEPDRPARRRGVGGWRGNAIGSVMAGAMLGMREVLEGPVDDEVVVVQEADGDPPGPDWLDVDLDFDDPGGSTVTVRPR